MNERRNHGIAVRQRRLPSFADLALVSAIALVLGLSWHGLPRPDAAPSTMQTAVAAPAPR